MAARKWDIPREKPKSSLVALIVVVALGSVAIGFAGGYFVGCSSAADANVRASKIDESRIDDALTVYDKADSSVGEKSDSSKKSSTKPKAKEDISDSGDYSVESEDVEDAKAAKDDALLEAEETVDQTDVPTEEEPEYYEEEPVHDETVEEDVVYVTSVDATPEATEPVEASDVGYSPEEFQYAGEIYDDEWRYTWYSQNVLPGEGLDIPGRHVENGYVVDEDGNVVLASCDLEQGTTMDIPVGTGVGKVYDYCPISGTIDVYVDF